MLALVSPPPAGFSLLDVGAASGDSARIIQAIYCNAQITNLDYNDTNLEKAPHPKLIANAFELPFKDGAFDYVMCSLFLHHFRDEEVVQLLKGFYRVARNALFVIDLERHVLPFLFLRASKPLFRWNHITVHDGLISVKASFRADEMRKLAESAGIGNAKLTTHRPAFRWSMVAQKGNR